MEKRQEELQAFHWQCVAAVKHMLKIHAGPVFVKQILTKRGVARTILADL